MINQIVFWALTSALAGFLFGFDTVVVSGAEQKIQTLWNLSAGLHGIAMASALYGTVLGSLLGGWPTDRFGRKRTLLAIGVLYVISAIWSALATNVVSFVIARMIGGLGIGISTVAAPLYISEIAPPKYRGRLAGLFQFNIVFGIIVAFGSNWWLARYGENAWRWMLGVAAFPSVLYTALCFSIPESPRWLLTRENDRAKGIRILQRMRPQASMMEIEAQAKEIIASGEEAGGPGKFRRGKCGGPSCWRFSLRSSTSFRGSMRFCISRQLWFDPRRGSEKAFLKALGDFAKQSNHPELEKVPWVL